MAFRGTAIYLERLSYVNYSYAQVFASDASGVSGCFSIDERDVLYRGSRGVYVQGFYYPSSNSTVVGVLLFRIVGLGSQAFLPFSIPMLLSHVRGRGPTKAVFLFFRSIRRFSGFSTKAVNEGSCVGYHDIVVFFLVHRPRRSLSRGEAVLSGE